jgi:hypothetical protein
MKVIFFILICYKLQDSYYYTQHTYIYKETVHISAYFMWPIQVQDDMVHVCV